MKKTFDENHKLHFIFLSTVCVTVNRGHQESWTEPLCHWCGTHCHTLKVISLHMCGAMPFGNENANPVRSCLVRMRLTSARPDIVRVLRSPRIQCCACLAQPFWLMCIDARSLHIQCCVHLAHRSTCARLCMQTSVDWRLSAVVAQRPWCTRPHDRGSPRHRCCCTFFFFTRDEGGLVSRQWCLQQHHLCGAGCHCCSPAQLALGCCGEHSHV